MPQLIRNGVRIDDSFAEAFPMSGTGARHHRARRANGRCRRRTTMTGFATSVIGCGCEAGVDREVSPKETPDGRPGVRVLLFAMSSKDAEKQLVNRLGQCVLTCPGSAVFSTVRRRIRDQGRRRASAISATNGRCPRSSTGDATGACR